MIKADELIHIGRFTKPHGVKGEMALSTDYDLSTVTNDLFIICEMDGIRVPFLLISCREKSQTLSLVQLEGVNTDEQAKVFNGKAAYLLQDSVILPDDDPNNDTTLSCAPPLQNGHTQSGGAQSSSTRSGRLDWRRHIGYTVIDKQSGIIGQVTDIDESTMNRLLFVTQEDGEILIPAALVESIDTKDQTIKVSLPEGFLEI